MGEKAEIWEHYEENKDDHSKVTCHVVKSNGEQCQKEARKNSFWKKKVRKWLLLSTHVWKIAVF